MKTCKPRRPTVNTVAVLLHRCAVHKMERKSESWHGDGRTHGLNAVSVESDVSTLSWEKKQIALAPRTVAFALLQLDMLF